MKMAFAPAMKHIACSASEYEIRPAANRMIELSRRYDNYACDNIGEELLT